MSYLPAEIRILRKNIKGIEQKVRLGANKKGRYIYFDNAASTPPLKPVLDDLNEFLNWYSGIHRGTGYKSLVSSRIYDDCHQLIGSFVKADPDRDTTIIVKNTTEAINKLSYRFNLRPTDIVITTQMEHHSNDLPWRNKAKVIYARVDKDGILDLDDLKNCLKKYYPRTKLLTVCGASNVTGHVNDVYKLAKLAHQYGCKIMVDGAQLIPHRAFDMKKYNDPTHIDFLVFSGHKIFSPFGSGVLIGPRNFFAAAPPEYSGGGTVKIVNQDKIFWADPPDIDEAGSPNLIGTYTLAKTLLFLQKLGMNKLEKHEQDLTDYFLKKLKKIPGISVYGSSPRVGVISFNLEGIHHALLGAILCYEAGIGIRTGCFCAQNYVRLLLGLKESDEYIQYFEQNRHDKIPGMVRVSLAAYNTREEIDYFLSQLQIIAGNKQEYQQKYRYSNRKGHYLPANFYPDQYIESICRQYMN